MDAMDCGATVRQAAQSSDRFVFPTVIATKRRLPSDHPLFSLGNVEREIFAKQSAVCTSVRSDPASAGLLGDDDAGELHFAEVLPCPVLQCARVLSSATEFEDHYAACHRNACSVCGCVLPSQHLLGVHVAERHDSFFAAMAARKKPVFECLVPACGSHRFASQEARREHMRDAHGYSDALTRSIVGGGPRKQLRNHNNNTKAKPVRPHGADVIMSAHDISEGAENMVEKQAAPQGSSPGAGHGAKQGQGKGARQHMAAEASMDEGGRVARMVGDAAQGSQDASSPHVLRPLSVNMPDGAPQRVDHGTGHVAQLPTARSVMSTLAPEETAMAVAGAHVSDESRDGAATPAASSPASKAVPGGNRRERRKAAREAGALKQEGGAMPITAADGNVARGPEPAASIVAGTRPAASVSQSRSLPPAPKGLMAMAPRSVCLLQSKAAAAHGEQGGAANLRYGIGGGHAANPVAISRVPSGAGPAIVAQAATPMQERGTSASQGNGAAMVWVTRKCEREAAEGAADIAFSSQGERIEEWGPHEAYLSCHHATSAHSIRQPGGNSQDIVDKPKGGDDGGGFQLADSMDVDVAGLTQSMSRLNAGSCQGNVPSCAFFGGRGRGRGQSKLVGFGTKGGSRQLGSHPSEMTH